MTTENEPPDALDRLRDAPVGTNDPNIVGDVGPTDVPPGEDPPALARQVGEEPADEPPDLGTLPGDDAYGG
jgi:hypothetical protein